MKAKKGLYPLNKITKILPWVLCAVLAFGPAASVHAQEAVTAPPAGEDELITLELQGVNILDVLKLLSKKSGLNIVAGKNVQGQVSLFLRDVRVMDALITILETTDLAFTEDRGILKVMLRKDYEDLHGRPYRDTRMTRRYALANAKADSLLPVLMQMKSTFGKVLMEARTNTIIVTETPEVLEDMEALIHHADEGFTSKVFELRYIKAEEISGKIQKIMPVEAGTMEFDQDSNRIYINSSTEMVDRIGELIEAFDVRKPQVLIEAKVLEVSLSDSFRFGIDWEMVGSKLGSFQSTAASAAYTVSAPTGAALTTLMLGSGNDDLQVLIQLIDQMGKTNTLSSPRLTVLNNEEAQISVATRQPFVSQTVVQSVNTSTTADQVQFVDVGVTLSVTPTISQDEYIVMKIKPEISSAGTPVTLEGVSSGSDTPFTRTIIPVVTTQELETVVMVKSTTTLVIGGLIQDIESKSMAKLPVLGNIPVLGRAFSSKNHDATKTELVIFLTPTILNPAVSTPEASKYFDQDQELLPHHLTGGYDYDKAFFHGGGPLRIDDKPYWEARGLDLSYYLPGRFPAGLISSLKNYSLKRGEESHAD